MDLSKANFSQRGMEFFTGKVVPNIGKIQDFAETVADGAFPVIKEAEHWYAKFKQYTAPYEGLTQCITGFVMMFFGGFFMTTIAVYEAINQSGGEQLQYNVNLLREQAIKVAEANREDDLKDEDNDGIADVKQISEAELGRRKFLLFLTTCDPVVVNDALHGLYLILLAVSATLRSQFARVVSIGASIGDVLEKSFAKFLLPRIQEQTPEEYRQWTKYVGIYISRFIAVTIAFRIQTVLSTVHSAYKGAREFIEGLNLLAKSQGREELTEGYADEALGVLLAILGVYLQLFYWSQLPGIVKILFFPAFAVEGVLKLLVSPFMYTHKPPPGA